jgi:uncharacterized protein (TIGR03437 family)
MKGLWIILAVTGISQGAEIETVVPAAACQPGGFSLIRFSSGVEVRPKPSSSFGVSFDASDYQGNAYDAALRSALTTWNSGGSTWHYDFAGYTATAPSSGDGQMSMVNGGRSFPAGVLAATLISAGGDGRLFDADIFFNPVYSFTFDGTGLDFESVALHELGHGLGLDHNDGCYPTPTVMQSALRSRTQVRSLAPPEISGLQFLYGGGGGGGVPVSVAASPSGLVFSGLAGGAAPASQNVSLSGTAGLAWTASASASWIQLGPSRGTLPAVVNVLVLPADLAAGLHSGRITISAGGFSRDVTVSLSLTAPNTMQLSASSLRFSAVAGGPAPAAQALSLTGTAGLAWTASITSGGGWLLASPSSGVLPAAISISTIPTGLTPAGYSGRVTITAGGILRELTVQLSVGAGVLVRDGGVRHGASLAETLTAGGLASVFGENLAAQPAAAAGFPLPVELGQTRVLIGGWPARLLYVSPRQINLVTPADLLGPAATLVVYNGGLASPAARVSVARQAPGVFSVLGNGAGAGAVTHADGSLIHRSSPLTAGEAVSVYLTGLGPLSPALPDGVAAPAEPLSRATGGVRLLVDGQDAAVLYAGAAPGFAGLQLVVATAPASLRRRYPDLQVEVDGALSNRVSAGGPSLAEVAPAEIPAGSAVVLTVRGLNLSPASALRLGGATIAGTFADGPWQSLRFVVPSRLVSTPGVVALDVVDGDAVSNHLALTIRP